MVGYMIDTAAAIDGLTAEGIPANQARAIVRTIAQRNAEIATTSDVRVLKGDMQVLKGDVRALKGDVQVLKDDVQALKSDMQTLNGDIQALKGDVQALKGDIRRLDARIDALRAEFKSEIKALESRLNMKIYLMAGLVVGALKALEYMGI